MYNLSSEYLEALERGEIQHISGQINPVYGGTIFLDENNLIGEVSYSRQCTANESEFGIGQLYTGTAEISVKSGDIDRESLRGGTLVLKWAVHGFDWILLGTWKITDPKRTSENVITITAQDCTGDLDVPINDNFVGAITLEARLEKIKSLTGVQFAQTAEEIKELIGNTGIIFGSYFCPTCRAEVAAIAGFMGGIAVANRQNKLEFRKFGTAPVLEIPADLRHKISLSEYSFGIRGVAYRDKFGRTSVREIEGGNVNTAGIPLIAENPYIWENTALEQSEIDHQYRGFLKYAATNLKLPDWTPGEVEYYGNPALELGDLVEISGGINGEKSTDFLITAEHWVFRGTHTLISAGASENAVADGGNGGISANQQMYATINTTKNISAIDLESTGKTSGNILSQNFSVREETAVFADITLNLRVLSSSEIKVNLLFDDIENRAFFVKSVTENEVLTAHFSAHEIIGNGIHKVDVVLSENCEILGFSAYIWGQNIVEIQPEPTYASDYEYEIIENSVRIKKYIGSAKNIAIPQKIEGVTVKIIGGGAFTGTAVEAVKIPEGVEEIE